MDRATLLEQLEKVTDKAATIVLSRGVPISMTDKAVLIGSVFIEKSKNGYNILSQDKSVLFENISLFDIAVIVAQRFNRGELSVIRQVLELEEKFSKYHTDMIHYLHCMKYAKKTNDFERLSILEDKFQIAEMSAKDIRDRITSFKRVK